MHVATDATPFANPYLVRSTSVTATERRRFYDHHGIAPGTKARVACTYCDLVGEVWRTSPTNFYSDNIEIDHIVPRSAGGALDVSNLTWACTRCNRVKGARLDWTSPNGRMVNGRFVS